MNVFSPKFRSQMLNTVETSFGQAIHEILAAIKKATHKTNTPLFLVGGAVRDFLLGRTLTDIDLVVEGDAICLLRAIDLPFGSKLLTYEPFRTATVTYNGTRIDIASARSEVYPKPGSLPVVTISSLDNDLQRRDFSINSMAIALNQEGQPTLIDPYQGLSDVNAGKVRVLHSKSFIDDPTRIFRAIRYEQRLGFKLDSYTLGLLDNALEAGMLDRLSGGRIRREFTYIFQEPTVSAILKRGESLGIWNKLHPCFNDISPLLTQNSDWKKIDQNLGFLAILTGNLSSSEAESLIRRLTIPSRLADFIRATISAG